MAKVTGPLMSMDASGTLGGAITFSKWKGIPVVRQYVTPANPNTEKQQAVRAVFQKATAVYKTLLGADVSAWARRAAGLKMSGYNMLVKTVSAVAKAAADVVTIKAVSSTAIVAGSTTVTFTTDLAGAYRISYGTNPTTPSDSVDVAAAIQGENTKAINGLQAGVTYYFRIDCTEAAPKVGSTGTYMVGEV